MMGGSNTKKKTSGENSKSFRLLVDSRAMPPMTIPTIIAPALWYETRARKSVSRGIMGGYLNNHTLLFSSLTFLEEHKFDSP